MNETSFTVTFSLLNLGLCGHALPSHTLLACLLFGDSMGCIVSGRLPELFSNQSLVQHSVNALT